LNQFKYIFLFLISIFLCSSSINENSISLGRDNDPRVLSDISKYSLFYKKAMWTMLSWFGPRNISSLAYPKSVSYFNSTKMVALTIDDGFCGKDNPNGDMTFEVIKLLEKYNAKATFFITGSHTYNTSNKDISFLLSKGHEIANHNMYDIPYKNINPSDFEDDLLKTNTILEKFTENISNWYRAPHASISDSMHIILDKYNLTHVIGDVFANDTSIPDPDWISQFLLKNVKPGSIIIIHMPERGVREWNYQALEQLLIGLKEQNFEISTLTDVQSNNNQ